MAEKKKKKKVPRGCQEASAATRSGSVKACKKAAPSRAFLLLLLPPRDLRASSAHVGLKKSAPRPCASRPACETSHVFAVRHGISCRKPPTFSLTLFWPGCIHLLPFSSASLCAVTARSKVVLQTGFERTKAGDQNLSKDVLGAQAVLSCVCHRSCL